MRTGSDDAREHPGDRPSLAVQHAPPGEHLCSFHGSDDEQGGLVAAFAASAFGAGDRLLYVARPHTAEAGARMLASAGIDVAAGVRTGQVLIRDFAEVYGSPHLADVGTVLARYASEAVRSRADGFPGLRVAVEMGDFVGALGSLQDVERWEATVTPAFAEAGIVGLCQYDRRLVDAGARVRIAEAHPAVAADDGTVPLATFTATADPSELSVAGEIDRSNAAAFARALRARALVGRRVHVDLGAVTFADVGSLRTLFEVMAEQPPRAVLVIRRVPDPVRRLLALLGWRDDRVVVDP